jgi:RNA-directed DNA polymerase
MAREFLTIQFERCVDDAVVYCVSKAPTVMVAPAIANRMVEAGCGCAPRTKTVYCKDES